MIEPLDVEVTTDENGEYPTGKITSGNYTVKFTKEGYTTHELESDIHKGDTKK